MAIRTIITQEDPSLRRKSRQVDKIDGRILTLLDDMAETMYAAEGVGLAAPQVGVLRRVIVVDVGEEGGGLYEAINPQLISASGEQDGPEGCLSVPGEAGMVVRPNNIVVEYTDRNGDRIRLEAEGFLARAFCHEMDHLEGQLFTDIMHAKYGEEA